MGGCAPTTQKLPLAAKIPPEFDCIKRYIRSYDESILFAEMNSALQLMATTSEDRFKKLMEIFHGLFMDGEADFRQRFNIILLLHKVVQARPSAYKHFFDQKISSLLVSIKDVNLADPAITSYTREEEYNYWQRSTSISLEFIQFMSQSPPQKKGENSFKDFTDKHSTLFPRKSQYLSLCPELKEKIVKEGKSTLAEMKTLRLTAIDETVQQIIGTSNFLPQGTVTERYLKSGQRHKNNEIFKMHRDILKIVQADHLRTLLMNELEGAALVGEAYQNAQKGSLTCGDFVTAYKQIVACRFPEVLKAFDEIANTSNSKAKKALEHVRNSAASSDPGVRLALRTSLSSIPHMPPKEFFSPDQIRSVFEDENDKSVGNQSCNEADSLSQISRSSISGRVKRRGSSKVITFTPIKKTPPGAPAKAQSRVSTPPLDKNPAQSRKPPTSPRENEGQARVNAECQSLVSENEELELLISALEEEKRICEQSLLAASSRKGNESYTSTRSFRSNRTAMSTTNTNTIELQRILRDKEAMIVALEHKYEMLLAEESEASFGGHDLHKNVLPDEAGRLANEVLMKSKDESRNPGLPEVSYYRKNETIKDLEKSKFLRNLYLDIDKSLHHR